MVKGNATDQIALLQGHDEITQLLAGNGVENKTYNLFPLGVATVCTTPLLHHFHCQ
jgi:hypothetical protein